MAKRMYEYEFRTDAASGVIHGSSVEAAVRMLNIHGEWSRLRSVEERIDISRGAWLQVKDSDGVIVLRRGEVA